MENLRLLMGALGRFNYLPEFTATRVFNVFAKSVPIILIFCLTTLEIFAQLTIRVTGVPASTPFGTKIFITGNFNNWNPSDPTKALTSLGGGKYSITLNPAPGTIEFKFTRGSWNTSEGAAGGGFTPNHKIAYNGQPKSLELKISSWQDLGPGTSGPGINNGAQAVGVTLLDDDFFIPQLNRTRRIWLYLPPDYNSSYKNYPVVYMQDGQSLFNSLTSTATEWSVDESLNKMFQAGDRGCIVVGIDHGGVNRINEYSPWENKTYGGGQGDEFLNFIVNTLKPYVDANYRTLSDRENTAIVGSSMGGLFSMYALIERQDVFSKAAIFSPAFWFSEMESLKHVLKTGKKDDVKVYFLAGAKEPADIEQGVEEVTEAMLKAGFSEDEIHISNPTDGQHAEWAWAREFPTAYQWLFAGNDDDKNPDAVTPVDEDNEIDNIAPLSVYPNPAKDWVRIQGADLDKDIAMQIIGLDGRIWRSAKINAANPIRVADLPIGTYVMRVKADGRNWESLRLIKQ